MNIEVIYKIVFAEIIKRLTIDSQLAHIWLTISFCIISLFNENYIIIDYDGNLFIWNRLKINKKSNLFS